MGFAGKLRYGGFILAILLIGSGTIHAQENEYFDSLLQRVDTIDNPVYMPMVSVDYGSLMFFGDVKNGRGSAVPGYSRSAFGNPSVKVNISTFVDNKHFFLANFSFISGSLSGEEHRYGELAENVNFKTELMGFGISSTYHFEHFLPPSLKLKPYVNLGFEVLMLNTWSDIMDSEGNYYHYWKDGSVRNIPEDDPEYFGAATLMYRDYAYGAAENVSSNLFTFAIPVGVGFTMKLSNRITCGMGAEYHHSFSDVLDNSTIDNNSWADDKNDGFMFAKASFQIDLFSEPKTKTVDLLYADLEMDPIFYDDEDADFILDHIDRCPGTPYGVLVDSLGCPFDTDEDGVPDYMDRERDTPPGAWVDENGVTLSEEDFLASLQRDSALNREDLDSYMLIYSTGFIKQSIDRLPEKFEVLDANGDGYISFEELLLVIDDYFDFKVEELRELNEYFFSQ